MIPLWRATIGLLLGCLGASGAAAKCSDLALVLAIDGSGSINAVEFAVQQHGYAAAFRNDKVTSALRDAGVVDVAVVLWGDATIEPHVLAWRRLVRAEGAEALAQSIERMPRTVTGHTGLGAGLWVALDLLDDPTRCALRSVINVSGDGMESAGPRQGTPIPVSKARARAMEAGVTINALAISTETLFLATWFHERVITGPDAFVMEITTFDDFADTIVEKLAREIRTPVFASALP
jgi:hypothetical protein